MSVLILAMIQDQALVAAKRRTKHFMVETKEKSPGHKQVVGSFKILQNSNFKISKESFALYTNSRSIRHREAFTSACMVDVLKLDLKMFRHVSVASLPFGH